MSVKYFSYLSIYSLKQNILGYVNIVGIDTIRMSIPQIFIILKCYGYEVIITPTNYYSSTERGNIKNKNKL